MLTQQRVPQTLVYKQLMMMMMMMMMMMTNGVCYADPATCAPNVSVQVVDDEDDDDDDDDDEWSMLC